ncbi:thioredoxin [Tumebacillus permanentifrigoris]|uniref:Thioredoxin n=1 Tax=Tumebacillus permanentifrigoris TaxID=378543 RepID=A0A316D5V1_9BACL|nr:thioredoxin [Tumebacillus permanentifrigoris]PWK09050.1 thioredoxin [Tumebacillus permanentifrigoris]
MASEAIVTVTDANFEESIQGDKPVLVDFWAAWCGPCKMLAPVLDDLSGEVSEKLTIGKLNVDENPATAQKFGVMSIPTLLVFKNGEVVKTLVGYQNKQQLLDKLADVI